MTAAPELARYLSLEAAAAITSPPLPIATLRYWLSTGKLTRRRVGRRVFVDRVELLALFAPLGDRR